MRNLRSTDSDSPLSGSCLRRISCSKVGHVDLPCPRGSSYTALLAPQAGPRSFSGNQHTLKLPSPMGHVPVLSHMMPRGDLESACETLATVQPPHEGSRAEPTSTLCEGPSCTSFLVVLIFQTRFQTLKSRDKPSHCDLPETTDH